MRVAYKTVSDAHREVALAYGNIAFMSATFSGCDWCDDCGGGRKAVAAQARIAERAERFLRSIGIEPVVWCGSCGYHRVSREGDVCEKCRDWWHPIL